MPSLFRLVLTAAMGVLLPLAVFAETIEFPEEELATESVLPVFDKTVVVRNRAITTEGRMEVGGFVGLNLLEALYKDIVYGVNGTYHFDETNGLNFMGMFQMQGLSGNGSDLKAGKGLKGNNKFDSSLAPSPEYYMFGNYQLTTYYGKISVTKQKAMNLSMYGLAGLGIVSFGDMMAPALNVGFGQKLYFNNNFALRFDLNLAMYRGPDPTSPKDGQPLFGGAERSSDDFDQMIYFRTFLTAGAVYLF